MRIATEVKEIDCKNVPRRRVRWGSYWLFWRRS